MRPNNQTTDEMWCDFLTAAAVFGRGQNYRTIGCGKSMLSRRLDFVYGVNAATTDPTKPCRLRPVQNRLPAFLCSK
jgi:hypothetical protein